MTTLERSVLKDVWALALLIICNLQQTWTEGIITAHALTINNESKRHTQADHIEF
jgi:hypothetical protein